MRASRSWVIGRARCSLASDLVPFRPRDARAYHRGIRRATMGSITGRLWTRSPRPARPGLRACRPAPDTPTMNPLKIGLFGIGLDAYWPQFHGLKDRLESYLDRVRRKLERPGRRRGQPGPDRHAREGTRGRPCVPPGRRRPDLPPRDDLRPVVDRPPGGAQGQGSGRSSSTSSPGRPSITRRSIAWATGRR